METFGLTVTKLELRPRLALLAQEMRANSERWFPDLHEDPAIPLWLFYSIGVSSEGGEQLDVSKKACRTGRALSDDQHGQLADELADVFTYLMLLCDELGIDIIDAYEAKRYHNEGRWGK